MNYDLSAEQIEFQTMARNFAAKELAPMAAKWDHEKIFPTDVIAKAGELGFCGLYVKEDVGGLSLGRYNAAVIFEELAGGCTSTTAYITIHNMVTWMIDEFAKPEIRKKYCPEMVNASLLGSYCLTEPGSGSDAASLTTKAEKKGDKYIINGNKAFISGAGKTDILLVMARTGDDSPSGISAFIVPASCKGISYGKNEEKMGWNSQPTRPITFENVEIPADHLLGAEGQGFKIAMKGLDGGRINIGTCSIGAAQAALNHAQKYMSERKQFGKELTRFQALRFKIADMVTELIASRQMVRLAAHHVDNNHEHANIYCAMAKRMATDVGFKVANEALQIFGGYGYTKEYPLERYVRDLRVHQILEGTNEIMRVIISRGILAEDGPENLR